MSDIQCMRLAIDKARDGLAEVHALRRACAVTRSIDLSGSTVYSTCEPCPMCFSACPWARVARIVRRPHRRRRARRGQRAAGAGETLRALGGARIELVPDLLRDECLALFELWAWQPGRRAY